MGKRGKQPTPTATLEKRGSWRAKTRPDYGQSCTGSFTLEKPEWMTDRRAIDKWDMLVPSLNNLGVITNNDFDVVARYCFWWGRFVYEAESGNTVDAKKAEECLLKLGALLGLSPADRTKVIVSKKEDKKDEFLRAI